MPLLNINNLTDAVNGGEETLTAALEGIETFFNTTKIDGDNIQDASITATQLASSAVTTAKIATSAVGTSALADGAVTPIKREQVSGSSTDQSGDFSVTITNPSGRPVYISFNGREAGLTSIQNSINTAIYPTSYTTAAVKILRTQSGVTTQVADNDFLVSNGINNTSGTISFDFPVTMFRVIDAPTANVPVTYTASVYNGTGDYSFVGYDPTFYVYEL